MTHIVQRLRITIDGRVYDVTVEDLDAAQASAAAPGAAAPVVPPPAGGTAPAAEAQAPRGDGSEVAAPLPGVVSDIKVEPGQAVRRGQVLAVLEAMKMDNEIPSPRAGTVREVRVTRGEQVAASQVLLVLE